MNEPLSNSEKVRYARHLTLPQVGVKGQEKLKNSSILVVGAGGLGSPSLLYLAAAGIGKIGIIDDDIVEITAVIALFGYLNRWNDSMGSALEDLPIEAGEKYLTNTDWVVGKHT